MNNQHIPFLPGYRRDNNLPQKQNFAKSQHFIHDAQGRPTLSVKTELRTSGGNGSLANAGASIVDTTAASSSTASLAPVPYDKYALIRRPPVASDFEFDEPEPQPFLSTASSTLPDWVAFDRLVLRFTGFFKESVRASEKETYRIRTVVVYYYLEDGSMHVAEPLIPNSGLPQGVFVKRHRVLKEDGSRESIQPSDLYIGASLNMYGRCFRLTDADSFTRTYFSKRGIELGQPESIPKDPYTAKIQEASQSRTTFKKQSNALTIHQEASLGKHQHGGIAATQQFLRNDGKVLRFYATYEDTKLYGEKRPYIVHFFLADDTVEVLEVNIPNSGRDAFPYLLKRSKLPKDHTEVVRDVAHVGDVIRGGYKGSSSSSSSTQKFQEEQKESGHFGVNPNVQYYTDRDITLGSYLNVYGRDLLICGCDKWTQDYYIKNYGLAPEYFSELSQTLMQDPQEEKIRIEVPPETGYGTEEDSLGSFLYLVPKQPKIDQKKLHEMEGVNLRFSAQFLNPVEVDVDRKFVITYYLTNDTMQIFEIFERNHGHIGGKFLERIRQRNPQTHNNEFFSPADFYIGGQLHVNKHVFIVLDADEYTKKFMREHQEIWNQEKGNLNDELLAMKHCGGKKFDPRPNASCSSLPDRRPF